MIPNAVMYVAAAHRVVVDLVRLPDAEARRAEPGYVGLAW